MTSRLRKILVFCAAIAVAGSISLATAQADQWVALFYHIHTNYSDEELEWATPIKLTVPKVLARADAFARSLNVPGAVAITEHNNWNAAADPAFHPVGNVRPIDGIEWAIDLGEVTVLGNIDKQLRPTFHRNDSTEKFLKYVPHDPRPKAASSRSAIRVPKSPGTPTSALALTASKCGMAPTGKRGTSTPCIGGMTS